MNKKEISVKEILLKGTFGGVKIGMTEEEVINLLGEPNSMPIDEEMGFKDYYYDWYEIFFLNYLDDSGKYKVSAFQNDSLDSNYDFTFENETIKITPWFFKYGLTFEEVEEELRKREIAFSVVKKYEITFMYLELGSRIGFIQNEENAALELLSIDYHPEF